MRFKLKAKKFKVQSSKPFLLSVLSLQLIAFFCCTGWAQTEIPKLTPAVQGAVYEAQQFIKKKEYLKAEKCLKKYIKIHPQNLHYLVEFTLGNVLALMGKEREALSHYKASTNYYEGYAPTWQNMGKIYFDLKQYEKAGDCLLKVYQTDKKKDPSALYNVAVSYIMAGKEKRALPYLERLVSHGAGPPNTEWLEALLKVCMDLKLKEKAFEVIHSLLKKNGNDPRWWKILGQLHLQQSDYKSAIAALTVYSYLTPLKKQEIMLLGDLSNAIGVPLKAAAYYEKSLTSGNNPAVYERLASAYIAARKPKKAIEALNRALEKKETSKLWFMMGQLLYKQEDFDMAYHAFNKGFSLDPENGQAVLMMGYCALQIDKKDIAKRAFQKASQFSRQRKIAKELLKQVALWKER